MPRPHYVIGISGVTNGGKTMLCDQMKKAFPLAETIFMDDYYWSWPEQKEKFIMLEEINHANWEDLTAVDLESFMTDVQKWIRKASEDESSQKPALLFLDGILIFNYPPLVPYIHKKYFLTLDKETCWQRRQLRSYDPPDPEGFFEKCVWPMYLKNKEDISHVNDIGYIDGAGDPEKIFQMVHGHVAKLTEAPLNS